MMNIFEIFISPPQCLLLVFARHAWATLGSNLMLWKICQRTQIHKYTQVYLIDQRSNTRKLLFARKGSKPLMNWINKTKKVSQLFSNVGISVCALCLLACLSWVYNFLRLISCDISSQVFTTRRYLNYYMP